MQTHTMEQRVQNVPEKIHENYECVSVFTVRCIYACAVCTNMRTLKIIASQFLRIVPIQ